MKILKNNLLVAVFILAFGIVAAYTIVASAQSKNDIVFPVAELSNCGSETECRTFCDKPGNMTACVNFAEKHNLVSKDEAERARKFKEIGAGPGGCKTKDSCESYCNDVSHVDECLTFAEKNNLMSAEDLAQARKVKIAVQGGAKFPGGCKNKSDCEVYCGDANHTEECLTFAESAGILSQDELAGAKKFLEAVKKGVKPPACRGKESCDKYCGEPGNFEECVSFAEAAGFVSANEAQMARKTGGKGPGDCHSKEECEKFCGDSANGEACFNFAKEHNLIPEGDLKNMQGGNSRMGEALNNAPPEATDCLNNALGSDVFQKLKSGQMMPSQGMGETMRGCFQKSMGPPGGNQGDSNGNQGMMPGTRPGQGQEMMPGGNQEKMMPGGKFSGPGGCSSPAECETFCRSNPQACQNQNPGPREDSGKRMMPPVKEGNGFSIPSQFPPGATPSLSPEQMQQFQQEKFKNGEQKFPPGMTMPSPEQMQKFKEQYQNQQPNYPSQQPQQQNNYQSGDQNQYRGGDQQQYQQYQQQNQQQYQGGGQYQQYQGGGGMPPNQPPPGEPPRSSRDSFFGSILKLFSGVILK